jgi:hypothetical protein
MRASYQGVLRKETGMHKDSLESAPLPASRMIQYLIDLAWAATPWKKDVSTSNNQ